jgi:hypothetical protein
MIQVPPLVDQYWSGKTIGLQLMLTSARHFRRVKFLRFTRNSCFFCATATKPSVPRDASGNSPLAADAEGDAGCGVSA